MKQQAEGEIVVHAKRQNQDADDDAAEAMLDHEEVDDLDDDLAGDDEEISIRVGKKPQNID